jgi:imidazolonepropionase-like amidohydrolase
MALPEPASLDNLSLWKQTPTLTAWSELATIGTAESAVSPGRMTNDMPKAGVGILGGCDTMIAGSCVHDELEAMVRGGMTPLNALQKAMPNPARYVGLADTSRTIAIGRRADLVLLDASPLVDMTNIERIRAVVVAGRFLDRELDDS